MVAEKPATHAGTASGIVAALVGVQGEHSIFALLWQSACLGRNAARLIRQHRLDDVPFVDPRETIRSLPMNGRQWDTSDLSVRGNEVNEFEKGA
jgi:hypothetical protein